MHYSVIKFFCDNVNLHDIVDKSVLDVGSYNVNGSLKDIIVTTMSPKDYIGTDISFGPNVDRIIPAESLIDCFGEKIFDVVICTEMLEHCEKWKEAIFNLKGVLKENGLLILTTRSKGFPLHNHPSDYWRFEMDDMRKIFNDMKDVLILSDFQDPGVFVYAKKPINFISNDLSNIEIYKIES